MSVGHEVALVAVGFAGGVLFALGVLVGGLVRDSRRGGMLDLDTPAAREAIHSRRPW